MEPPTSNDFAARSQDYRFDLDLIENKADYLICHLVASDAASAAEAPRPN